MQRTYWHLGGKPRTPSDYEVASSKLHWWPQLGFSVETPLAAWHRERVLGSPLQCPDWEQFADPAELTYSSYVRLGREREAFADGLLAFAEGKDHFAGLAPEWLDRLGRLFAPLRFPCHGLQMVAAYVGSLAPSGRITIAAGFQAADELRRVHRIAQQIALLERVVPGIAERGRAAWQDDPAWQPMREAIERLLVAWDFGESFTALALVVKPCFDELFVRQFARLALAAGDDLLGRLVASFDDACRWHRAWSVALVRVLLESEPRNAEVLRGWIERWTPRARAAVEGLRPLFDADAVAAAAAAQQELLKEAGLEIARPATGRGP